MTSFSRVFLVLAMVLVVPGCSVQADIGAAERSVPAFHAMLDTGRFAAIYRAASAELQGATSERDFVALLDAVHRKLGASQRWEKISWGVNYRRSGTFVTLLYKTRYAGGEASEQFVFHMQGKAAALAGFHISANALILN